MINMKKIILTITLIITAVMVLASCNKASDVDFKLNLTPSRERVAVSLTVDDSNNVITEGSLRAKIFFVEDDDESLVDSLNFDESETDEQTGEFKDLKKNTEYLVKLECTISSEITILKEKKVTTTNAGDSEANPILIKTTQNFLDIANDYDAFYKLENDIDFEGKEIKGLFKEETPFVGNLNGNGKTITNFKQTSSKYVSVYNGLFGYIGKGAEVYDLTISDATIEFSKTSESYTGILAGVNNGEISNVNILKSSVSVTGGQTTGVTYVGGFVGVNAGIIENCSVGDSVDAVSIKAQAGKTLTVGGFAATNGLTKGIVNEKSIIDASSAYVTIDAKNNNTSSAEKINIEQYVGGFVGQSSVLIKDSYADATIVATSLKQTSKADTHFAYVGGFAAKVFNVGLMNVACNVKIDYKTEDMTELSAKSGAYVGLLVARAVNADVYGVVLNKGEHSVIANDNALELGIIASNNTNDFKFGALNEVKFASTSESFVADVLSFDDMTSDKNGEYSNLVSDFVNSLLA